MDIVSALKDEEAKLQHQLTAVKTAISALNGGSTNGCVAGVTPAALTGQAAREPCPLLAERTSLGLRKLDGRKIRAEKAKGKKAK